MRQGTITKTKVKESKPDTAVVETARVILLNDDLHTFDEVIHQLVLAINCSAERAEEMAYTVHFTGQCEVFAGPMEDCLEVSAILEDIDLRTEIRFGV